MMEKLRMLFMTSVRGLHAAVKAAKPLQQKLSNAMHDEKARSALLKLKIRVKKRRVKWRRAFQQNVWQLLVGTSVYSKEPPGNPRHCLISARCSDPTEKCFAQLIHNFRFAGQGADPLATPAAKRR
jgi:hypothetical protein